VKRGFEARSKLEAKDVLPNINHMQAAEGPKNAILSLVTLTFDLNLQSCPSKGPNTSSVGIWRKSVQGFPKILHTQTKKSPQTDGIKKKQNLPQ